MKRLEVLLYLIAPVVGILYSLLEHHGFWDKLLGRKHAINGLRRLRSAAGYPQTFIRNKATDRKQFKALFKRIKKIVKKLAKNSGAELPTDLGEPAYITTGGQPIHIQGLPPDWPQASRFFYSDNFPVLVVFGDLKDNDWVENGKAFKACTLKDIDDWIKDEKEDRKIYVGTLMIGIIAIVSIIVRLMIHAPR